MIEKNLDSVLRELRSEVNEVPPASVEIALRAEFRRIHAKRRVKRNARWAAAGLSIATAAAAVLLLFSTQKHNVVTAQQAPVREPAPVIAKVVPAIETPVKLSRVRTHTRTRRSLPRLPDRSGEFVAIPYTESVSAAEQLDVYRVQMPRAMVAKFGLPLSAGSFDSVATADVVVGSDGIARAIRFVR